CRYGNNLSNKPNRISLQWRAKSSTSWLGACGRECVGGPARSREAAKRCTERNGPVGPTLINSVGGPARSREAAKRCSELNGASGLALVNGLVEADPFAHYVQRGIQVHHRREACATACAIKAEIDDLHP